MNVYIVCRCHSYVVPTHACTVARTHTKMLMHTLAYIYMIHITIWQYSSFKVSTFFDRTQKGLQLKALLCGLCFLKEKTQCKLNQLVEVIY